MNIVNTAGDLYFFCFVAASAPLVAGAYRAGSPRFRGRFRGVALYFANGLPAFMLFFAGHALGSDNLLTINSRQLRTPRIDACIIEAWTVSE